MATSLGANRSRAFGYCRVSTHDQAESGTSVQQQAEAIAAYCAAQAWDLAAVFIDDVSGARDDRPGLQDMLAGVARGDRILVLKLDRWARNVRNALKMLDGLERQGVAFVSVRDGIDTTTPSGRLMRTVLFAMAEWEADTIHERVEAGRRGTVLLKHRRANGRVPFGYKRGRKAGSLLPDPDTGALVRRIFGLRAKRKARPGFSRIATLLTSEQIPSPQGGRRWYAMTVKRLVENSVYAGTLRYGTRPQGRRTKGQPAHPIEAHGVHEPLVSAQLWRLANRKPVPTTQSADG